MPNDLINLKTYDFAADPAPLEGFLQFRPKPRRKITKFSSIPGHDPDPRKQVDFADMYLLRHPMATTATYELRNTHTNTKKGEDPYDRYEVLKTPQDALLSLPPLDHHLQFKINQRRALMISGYLAVTLPITALVLARVFTTSLVPLDPLFDFVVVFFMACVLTNVALFAHNHVDTVTKQMTAIVYKSTSVEMKKRSAPVEMPVAAPVPSEALRLKHKELMQALLKSTQEKLAKQEEDKAQEEMRLKEQEEKQKIKEEPPIIDIVPPAPISPAPISSPPPVGRLVRWSTHAKNIFKANNDVGATADKVDKQTPGLKPSRMDSFRSLLNPKK